MYVVGAQEIRVKEPMEVCTTVFTFDSSTINSLKASFLIQTVCSAIPQYNFQM